MGKQRDQKMGKLFQNRDSGGAKKGRIGRLDEQTLGYYRRVQENINSDFQEQDDKELFLKNVFHQLTSELLKVSQNQTASTIVEGLLPHASSEQCQQLLQATASDWELACYDRFASHVTQSLLLVSWRHLCHEESKDEEVIVEYITDLHNFIVSKLAFHMQHTYASHIVRSLLEVLGGAKVSDEIIRSKVARQQPTGKSNEFFSSYKSISCLQQQFTELCEKLVTLQKLEDHAKNYLSNPVLQTMILVCHVRHKAACESLTERLIDNTDMFSPAGDNSLPEMLTHETGSRLVEQVLSVLPNSLYSDVLTKLEGSLVAMALHPTSNFVAKKLIAATHTPDQFVCAYDAVIGHMEDILGQGHFGVISSLAQGCVKHCTKQKKFIKALQKSFHCYSPQERQSKLFPLLASLTAYEVFFKLPADEEDATSSDDEDETEIEKPELKNIMLHGSLLLQEILRFSNPIPVITSMLDLSTRELVTLSCHPCGSRILDAFFSSPTVGEKSRNELFSRLKGTLISIACDKSGSRTIDSMWAVISLKQRVLVAKELSKHESRLRGDRFGMHVWRNCALGNFVSREDEWKKLQSGNMKKRKMFDDIIKVKKQKTENEEGKEKNSLALDEQESVDVFSMLTAKPLQRDTQPKKSKKSKKKK